MKMKFCLILFLFCFTFARLGSLSLYYTSGTTFINLKKPSQRASIIFEFKPIEFIPESIIKKLSKVLQTTKIDKSKEKVIFQDTKLGNVTLTKKSLTTSLFNSPNGERQYQGWILNEEDYYTKEQEKGDEELVKEIVHVLETYPVNQVSIRVNVEVPMNPTLIRDLAINMFTPANRRDMTQENNFKLESPYSTGFLKKLLAVQNKTLTYLPTMDELFEDYVIRQFAEKCGLPSRKAFTYPIKEIKDYLLGNTYFQQKFIHKLPSYALDLLPILLNYKPDDEISKILLNVVTPSNTVQFREFKGLVDVSIRRAVGFVKVTELYGPIVHDSALSQICYLQKSTIKQIREKILNNQRVIFKYITWDPESCSHINRKRTQTLRGLYQKDDVVLGFIAVNLYGIAPLIIPGESVVWHQRTEHRFNIWAKYNPAMISFNVGHLLENKYFEFLYFNTYCPGVFPKTYHVRDILPPDLDIHNVTIDQFVEAANKTFPNGWVVKGIWDYNGAGDVLSHRLDYNKLINTYKSSSYLKFSEKSLKLNLGCEPVEDLYSILRTGAHFAAWKFEKILTNIPDAMIQEYIPVFREYRVECYASKCPLGHMSSDEHEDEKDLKKKWMKRTLSVFNQCLDNIPEKIRGIPLTSDVAFLNDTKTARIFETNPGGNGYLLHHEFSLLRLHNQFLWNYDKLVTEESKSNSIHQGLTNEEQISFVKFLLKKWDIDLGKYERRFKLLSDRIIDLLYVHPKGVILSRMNSTEAQPIAPNRISIGRRYKHVRVGLEYITDNIQKIQENPDFLSVLTSFYQVKEGLSKKNYDFLDKMMKYFFKIKDQTIQNYLGQLKMMKKELKDPLTDENISDLAQFLMRNLETYHCFQTLNLKIKNVRNELFSLFETLIQQKVDWNSRLFPRFKLNGFKDFEILFQRVKNNGTAKEITDLSFILDEFSDGIDSLRILNRTGFVIPGVSLSKVLQDWIPSLRTTYEFISPNSSKIHDLKYNQLYLSLTHSIVKIVQVLSDNSLFYVNKTQYLPEFTYLLDSMVELEEMEEIELLANLIDSIIIFSGDDDLQIYDEINRARRYLLDSQTNKGAWMIYGQYDLKASFSAMKSLLEHSYLTEEKSEMYELVSFDKYKERLERIGLFKTKEFFYNNEKYQNLIENENQVHDEL